VLLFVLNSGLQKEVVQVWLYENTAMKIEGVIVGFDEYMNIVLDNAEEVYVKSGTRSPIGELLFL
jgi:small nuclear ribonucleoprotein E